ncbi:hypothetical protein CSKR_102563 [Clonorchis sinensis]|uniref:Uncharacterized protein n=1 Tax=Clonorchis sinensis TaxID=79923 RepID=A0A419QF72_CLOSI|nr:hypothetical protein CSKR_102563 [Clonorchis sinensis]
MVVRHRRGDRTELNAGGQWRIQRASECHRLVYSKRNALYVSYLRTFSAAVPCMREQPGAQHLDFTCQGLGNLAVFQPSFFLRVVWQIDPEKMPQLNDLFSLLFFIMRLNANLWPWGNNWLSGSVRRSNPASATRLSLSRLGQPDSIPALVLPSGSMAAGHRKGVTAGRFIFYCECPRDTCSLMPGWPLVRGLIRSLLVLQVGKWNVCDSQQAAFALILALLGIGVYCVLETRIHGTGTVDQLTIPSLSTRSWLRTSGDPEAAAAECARIGIVLREVFWLSDLLTPQPTCSDAIRAKFYGAMNALLRQAKSSDIVVVAGPLSAQVGRSSASENRSGGRHGLDVARTDSGERLSQLHQVKVSVRADREVW